MLPSFSIELCNFGGPNLNTPPHNILAYIYIYYTHSFESCTHTISAAERSHHLPSDIFSRCISFLKMLANLARRKFGPICGEETSHNNHNHNHNNNDDDDNDYDYCNNMARSVFFWDLTSKHYCLKDLEGTEFLTHLFWFVLILNRTEVQTFPVHECTSQMSQKRYPNKSSWWFKFSTPVQNIIIIYSQFKLKHV